MLQKFREAGLTLNEKCQFAMARICFLGHVINSQGIRAHANKIKVILDMPEPKDVVDVGHGKQIFTTPIQDLLKTENTWTWGAPQQIAFLRTKKEQASETVLAQPSSSHETIVSA